MLSPHRNNALYFEDAFVFFLFFGALKSESLTFPTTGYFSSNFLYQSFNASTSIANKFEQFAFMCSSLVETFANAKEASFPQKQLYGPPGP